MSGIADPAVTVGVGQLHHLDEQVQVLDGMELVALRREALEQVEDEQRGQALRRRRRLVDRVAAIRRGDRLAPLAGVSGEIVGGQEPVLLEPARDRLTDATGVEDVGAGGGEVAQRAGEVGLAEQLAQLRRAATGGEDALPLGI